MGTTVTIALVDASAGTISFGHVGDSRAYRLRDGALEQVTTDHSLVAELVESGVLTPEEAERHPQRSAITKAVGTEPSVDADVFTRDTLPAISFSSAPTASRTCSRSRRSPPRSREPIVTLKLRETRSSPRPTPGRRGQHHRRPLRDRRRRRPRTVARAAGDRGYGRAHPRAGERTEADGEPSRRLRLTRRAEPEPIRHGAGAGGRIAALALIVAVLAIGLLVLYLAVR